MTDESVKVELNINEGTFLLIRTILQQNGKPEASIEDAIKATKEAVKILQKPPKESER